MFVSGSFTLEPPLGLCWKSLLRSVRCVCIVRTKGHPLLWRPVRQGVEGLLRYQLGHTVRQSFHAPKRCSGIFFFLLLGWAYRTSRALNCITLLQIKVRGCRVRNLSTRCIVSTICRPLNL